MFNISFGEVFIIAVIGLAVIGPKRLPETARFVGHLVSRLQRQAASVKNDIRREMELEDIKSIHRDYADAKRDAENAFNSEAQKWRSVAKDAEDATMQPPSAETDAGAKSSAADSNSKTGIADKSSASETEKDAASSGSDSDSKTETKTETEFGDSPDWSARGDSKSGGDSKPPAKAA